MLAVGFSSYGKVELQDVPRPALRKDTDAIVLVTTAAIGPWDVDRYESTSTSPVIPGGEFAGIIVEIGSKVLNFELDDLVSNTVQIGGIRTSSFLFGTNYLAGGHAEYVRVPQADNSLIKISAAAEERSLMAGGTVGLGMKAASAAIERLRHGSVTVYGANPIAISMLSALDSSDKGLKNRVNLVESHDARRTLGARHANATVESVDALPEGTCGLAVIPDVAHHDIGAYVEHAYRHCDSLLIAEPYGLTRLDQLGHKLPTLRTITSVQWPSASEAQKIAYSIQVRKLELTPLVSHVVPLDEAQSAYEMAANRSPGVQQVLLKP